MWIKFIKTDRKWIGQCTLTSLPYFWLLTGHTVKSKGKFLKILWPSQNIWTLKKLRKLKSLSIYKDEQSYNETAWQLSDNECNIKIILILSNQTVDSKWQFWFEYICQEWIYESPTSPTILLGWTEILQTFLFVFIPLHTVILRSINKNREIVSVFSRGC